MTKKIISLFLAIMILCTVIANANASDNIMVTVDEKPVIFDVTPKMINSRVMVPIRAIFESMGAIVSWNDKYQCAYCYKDNVAVIISLNSDYIQINGKNVKMDCEPILMYDRVLVPTRYVAEAFGYNVEWAEQTQTVKIMSKENIDVSKILYYKNYSDVPDFGSYTGAVLVTELSNSFAYYGISDSFILEYTDKYKKLLKALNYVEIRDGLFQSQTRTVLIHIGNTNAGKMIFVLIDQY